MGLERILGNVAEWVKTRPESTIAYAGSFIFGGLAAYGVNKGVSAGDFVLAATSLTGLAAGVKLQRREASEHNLYLRIGEIIECNGFDSVVGDPNLRKLARRYAKRHDMLDDYNSALMRYAVSGLKSVNTEL